MSETTSVDQLQKVHAQLAFIHQVLTQRTQFHIDEFDLAKDAARTITEMANKLADEIKAQMTPASEAVIEVSSEQV